MSRQLQVGYKLEMLAVVRFLCAKRCNCTEMYRQLHEVDGENAMSRHAMGKWCNMFENGRTDTDNVEGEERRSTATNSEIAARVNERILANRLVAADEIANKLSIFHMEVYVSLLSSILNSVKFELNSTAGTQHIGRWTEILPSVRIQTYAMSQKFFK
ncbi:hypothetical protein AVEN_88353-1 [Araneus ventricosus]|uniref:Mos1 transposase HTH domain-containing protein n=1 Tax=Araneus ventricosus TaxID=182803 RepID=A0A4Y2VN45_ARAVE|nr:hypothetical protein AVEN_48456-1 [Araneus ventricosus]GBO25121.1 hypothetical protein AVEN_88353-1 [Araneus ventricosus]